jgi:phosphoribosylamine-glycine ligase
MCVSPKCGVDLVTGKLFARDAKLNRYQLERTGCGEQAQWFEPLPEMDDDEHIEIAHAATKLVDGKLSATGGRVLSVVSTAKTFHKARKHAYKAIEQIKLEGSHYRTDIALKVDEGKDD